MDTRAKLFTLDDLADMPRDGKRREIRQGLLVEMNPPKPRHQVLKRRLANQIAAFVSDQDLGFAELELGFVLARDPDEIVFPDVAFIDKSRAQALNLDEYIPGPPDLAVEIISPTDRQGDIEDKVALYLQYGTRLIWLLFPKGRYVTVIRADRTRSIVTVEGVLDGEGMLPGFALPLHTVFDGLDE
jgi:Uma2 family endonuclease